MRPDAVSRPSSAARVASRPLRSAKGRGWITISGSRSTPLLLFTLLLMIGAVGASYLTIRLHRVSDMMAAAPIGPATHVVIFVIDGAGPSDLSTAPTPHIADLARHGVTYTGAWVGQLEDVGPSSNATIATGVVPRRHGIVGFQWRDARTGSLDGPTTPEQVHIGALDAIMQAHAPMSLAGLLKSRNPSYRILSVGGVGCADASAAGTWLADYVVCPARSGRVWVPATVAGHALPRGTLTDSGWSVPLARGAATAGEAGWKPGQQDNWVTNVAIRAMRRTHPSLTTVNFPEIGALAPSLASQRSSVIAGLVSGIDNDIGRVVSEVHREGVSNQTVFVVTSDQAVTSLTTRSRLSDLSRAVTAAGGQRLYIQPGETTMLGLGDALQGQPVAQAIQDEHLRGMDALYYKQRIGTAWSYATQYVDPNLPGSFAGAMQEELAAMQSGISPDVVLVGAPGSGVAAAGQTGSGLGAQWDCQHIPLIIAGHGVVSNVASRYPARLVDVAPTVAALLWLPPLRGDGSILADAMAQPPGSSGEAQRAEGVRLAPIIEALKTRPSEGS